MNYTKISMAGGGVNCLNSWIKQLTTAMMSFLLIVSNNSDKSNTIYKYESTHVLCIEMDKI